MFNVLVLLLLLATCHYYSCLSIVHSSWTDNYNDCRYGVDKASKQYSFIPDDTLQNYSENIMQNTEKGYKKYTLEKYGASLCSKLVIKAETFSLNSHITTSHGVIHGCEKKWSSKISKWNINKSKPRYGCAYRRNGSNYGVLCIYCAD